MSSPRGVEERISWFLDHDPNGSGMCAQHTWHSLGGDYGNPPAWGCSDANACVDKVMASGRYWTPQTWTGPPPRGAWVGYRYGNNGHACLSLGDGRIATTDPSGGSGQSGIEDLDYPSKWGADGWTVWTDQYAGVRFEVGSVSHGPVYLSKLVYGQLDSDSVRRLQLHLNAHPLDGGSTLPVTGNYLDETDQEVRFCQQQHGFGSDPAGGSSVGPKQAAHLFTNCACEIVDETEPTPTPPPDGGDVNYFHGYTGKPSGTLTVVDGQGYVPLDFKCKPAPFAGLEFHMLYANCEITWDSSGDDGIIRVKYVRDAFGGEPADDTGYQDYCVPKGSAIGDPDGFLITCTHWEAGEAGRGGKWYIRCDGAIKQIKIGTRYGKVGVVA